MAAFYPVLTIPEVFLYLFAVGLRAACESRKITIAWRNGLLAEPFPLLGGCLCPSAVNVA
jgi:hypothetical protein